MYALANELATTSPPVVTTTTTKIFPPSPEQSPCLLLQSDDPELKSLPELLRRFGRVTVAKSVIPEVGKLEGISEATVSLCSAHARFVLVEADGASGRPIKAPAEWEPVIPSSTDLVIPVVGLDCLGQPATSEWVFRLDRFAAVTEIHEGATISPRTVARLLSHPDGGLKGVPEGAVVIPFLNAKSEILDEAAIAEIASSVKVMAAGKISRIIAGRTTRTCKHAAP